MSERFFWCNKLDYPYLVCSELGNSCIRVAVDDCSVTECRPWRPPFQTNRQNCTCAHKTLQTQWERTHGAGCTRPWFRTAEPLGERRYGNCITTTCGVFCFFQKEKKKKMLVSKMQLWLWNICLSFSKIWADKFFLVCKFYSLKYKIYGHDIWTWEFSHVWNKGETGYSYIISLLKTHSVEFFI